MVLRVLLVGTIFIPMYLWRNWDTGIGNFSKDTDTKKPSQDLNPTRLIPEPTLFQSSNCKHFIEG